jgi:hypothetical protein
MDIASPEHGGGMLRAVFHFSRSLYRELAPLVSEERVCPTGASNHERVLESCEAAIRRLAVDRHYFARPSRTLFQDVRIFFPICAQERVWHVVDRHMTQASELFAAEPMVGYELAGTQQECRATTRRGTPCRRTPLPRNGYCPSHQHLADAEGGVPLAA